MFVTSKAPPDVPDHATLPVNLEKDVTVLSTPITSSRKQPRFKPGSITPISGDEITAAWKVRDTDPDHTRSVLLDARPQWRLNDLAAHLGVDVSEVRPLATPAITGEDAELLRRTHAGDYSFHDEHSLPHIAMDTLVSSFHAAGWSYADIATVLDLSRQAVHRNFGPGRAGDTPPIDQDILGFINHRPGRVLVDPRRLPAYAVNPERENARVPVGIVPQRMINRLAGKIAHYGMTDDPTDRFAALRYARRIMSKYPVSYTQLSRAAGCSDKYALSRYARWHGEDTYVPGRSRPLDQAS